MQWIFNLKTDTNYIVGDSYKIWAVLAAPLGGFLPKNQGAFLSATHSFFFTTGFRTTRIRATYDARAQVSSPPVHFNFFRRSRIFFGTLSRRFRCRNREMEKAMRMRSAPRLRLQGAAVSLADVALAKAASPPFLRLTNP